MKPATYHREFGHKEFGHREFGHREFGHREFGHREFGHREFGGFFHWSPNEPAAAPVAHPWGDDCVLCGSGVDAFRGLLEHGRSTRGWQRLWAPSYLCQEVMRGLLTAGLPVVLYDYCRSVSSVLNGLPWLKVLEADGGRTCQFASVVLFDSEDHRDFVRQELIDRRISLPVLWQLDDAAMPGIPEEHHRFSKTLLCIPCDARYDQATIETVSGLIRDIGNRSASEGRKQ